MEGGAVSLGLWMGKGEGRKAHSMMVSQILPVIGSGAGWMSRTEGSGMGNSIVWVGDLSGENSSMYFGTA